MKAYTRAFGVFFSVCLVVWISTVPALAVVSCKDWNTKEFFKQATVADVSHCLLEGVQINTWNLDASTPLHKAAKYTNDPKVITILLNAGAEINATTDRITHWRRNRKKGEREETPLHFAAEYNTNHEVVATLLDYGSNVNARDYYEETPLHYAAEDNNNPKIISVLVTAGADPNARDSRGETPLHDASEYSKNPRVITALVAAGADPDAQNIFGETPRQIAKNRNPLLLEAFSKETIATFKKMDTYERVATKRSKEKVQPQTTYRKQQIEVRRLAARVSCEKWNTSGFFLNATGEDVSRCLKAGANLNTRNQKGRTPLHTAAVFGKKPEVVAVLIKAGADLSVKDKRGRTPLQFAEKFSKTPAVVAVLKEASTPEKAKVIARKLEAESRPGAARVSCAKWNTPAFFKSAGLADISRCLKSKNPNVHNENGRTPLHYAAQGEEPALVATLVKAGADPNARDAHGGWTPLHLAAWFGKSPAVVAALLAAGADPAARDKAGKTPWDYAEQNAALKDTAPYRRLNEERFR